MLMRWHFTRHDPLFLRQLELSPLIPLHVLVCVLSCDSVSGSLASFMPVGTYLLFIILLSM